MKRIAIIDSGVKCDHPAFSNVQVKGFSITVNDSEKILIDEDFHDEIGHGTAVFYLINKSTHDCDITNIKIYDRSSKISTDNFEHILEYILKSYCFDIINISMGIVVYGNTERLQNICNSFKAQGTIIVSAFDNNGAVSFPAALDGVVGVDGQANLSTAYISVQNSIVNVIGNLKNQKVAWIEPDYILVKGSSFICAEITAKLAISGGDKAEEMLNSLCGKKIVFNNSVDSKLPFKIFKAVVFPFNKEIHAIARFESYLKYSIVDYYSVRVSGKVGKSISEIIPNCDNQKTIKNIDEINWDTFDTLIIGHSDEYRRIINVDYKEKLIKEAIHRGKNIYTFDYNGISDIQKDYKLLFSPVVTEANISKRYGKLYKPNIPIIAICGTNSKQGKFSLQLYIRNKLLDLGYSVGQIGTEASSLLFDMDEVFPCGYNGQVYLTPQQTSSIINKMIWDISQKGVDIILAGCQSGLLGFNDRNIDMIPFNHQIFFQSLQTDAIILCVNEYDSLSFVKRVINYAEGVSGAKVLGVVCFPYSPKKNWMGAYGTQERISVTREKELKEAYLGNLGKRVFMLDKNIELAQLVDECLEFFQG